MAQLHPFEIPTFDDVESERLHLKQRLAATCRIFGRFGYDEGVAGHVTARDPEHADRFWVNGFGIDFRQVAVSNLICVDHLGEVVEGDHPVNRAAFAIHSQVHQARPDIVAAAHTHSLHGKAFSTLGVTLDPLTQDSCAFHEDHSVFDDYTGVVMETSEGRRIADALGGHKLVILRNHGLLSVGTSVDAAAWWFIAADRSCHAQLLAMAAGKPVLIDHDQAVLTRTQVGSEIAGMVSFHPLWNWIVNQEPDLLE